MKIIDLVYETLLEEVKNKKLFESLVIKWYGVNASDQQKIETEDIYNGFNSIKEGINVNSPNVGTFLSRFNGSNATTREMFHSQNLKDIRKYSLIQIIFLLRQFNITIGGNAITTGIPEVLKGKDLPPNPERIEASKSMWYGKNGYLIIDEGDFRVYKVDNIPASIAFGYYEGYVSSSVEPYASSTETHMQWCITRYNRNNNLWSGYRDRRSFYFVIDESKAPEVEDNPNISQYYLCVIQYATDSDTKYRLTSILNDGRDPVFTENGITRIYPKMAGHFGLIQPIEYDGKKEAGEDVDVINLMNEVEGNEFEFAIMDEEQKKHYIDRGKPIVKVRSWNHMTNGLKKSYIDMTEQRNIFERFGPNLVDAIMKKPAELKSLDRRLKNIGIHDGVGYFVRQFLEHDFRLVRKSINNPNIVVIEKKTNKKVGVYDTSKNRFVTLDGVIYGGLGDDDLFVKTRHSIHIDNDDVPYLATPYRRDSTSDVFYTLYDTTTASPTNANAFILSQRAWDNLKRDLESSKPEQQSDINELNRI